MPWAGTSQLASGGRQCASARRHAGARYPLRIDPFIQQGEKLTGGGESGEGEFGCSVALSSDGNTALIGGYQRQHGRRRGVGLHPVRDDLDPAGRKAHRQRARAATGEFGSSVALSADGNTALIGGTGDNSEHGAAWVFTRSGSTWTQQGAKLTGSGESGAGEFGSSVALVL